MVDDYIKRGDAVNAVADMLAFEAEMDYCGTFTSDDFIDDAKGYFEDIPSADVVPVVRCKDCKHRAEWNGAYGCDLDGCFGDRYTDGFCDRAERKDDE